MMLTVRVGQRRIETPDVVALDLVSTDQRELPPFSAGAHIDVEIRPGLVRQYSLCNNPAERNSYRIGVLNAANSRGGSAAMHALVVGDLIRISEPRNLFPLDSGNSFSVLLAGGIGITPILCMAERLLQTGAGFNLHYFTKSRKRTPFLDHILNSSMMTRTSFHFDDDMPEARFDLDNALKESPSGSHLYICGPPGFIEWAISSATRVGIPNKQVHREYFAPSDREVNAVPDSEFQIKIASSGKVINVDRGKTVLDALRESGIEVPRSCEQGICGTCLTRVLSGSPDHRDFILTASEREANNVFAPCCSRSLSAQLVIDL